MIETRATELNLWEAVEIIRMCPRDIPNFLWSDTGFGKTDAIGAVARLDAMKFKPMIAQIMAPTDVQGLPIIHREEGVETYVEYIKASLLPSETRDGPEGIWFVDELPNAPRAVQAALQTIFTKGELNEYKFPKGWKQIAAGNRAGDRANTFELPRPVANRFMHLNVKIDHAIFLEWGSQQDGSSLDELMFGGNRIKKPFPRVADLTKGKSRVHPHVRAFLGMAPTEVFSYKDGDIAFATPRTWHMTSWVLYALEQMKLGDKEEKYRIPMIFGLIGDGAGSLFEAYLRDASILPNMRELLDGTVKLIKGTGRSPGNFLDGNGYQKRAINAAQQYAIAVGLAAIVDTESDKDLGKFFAVVDKFVAKDQKVVSVSELALRDPQVAGTKHFAKYGKEVLPRLAKMPMKE